jgi:zinc protease
VRSLVTPLRTLVDGVPTFYVDVDGPFVATLAFRVGRADERLPYAGVTHLLEHLAMPTDDIRGVEADASVGATWTLFWAQGPPDAVVAHLNEVARNLAQPPLERLETERRILLTEAAGRGGPVGLRLAYMLRFGARGYGLVGHDEPGLHRLTANDVSAWAAARFTRGNTALWLTRPPAGLQLPLPEGDRHPAVPPEPIDYLRFPCVYRGATDGVLLSMVVQRRPELWLALNVAGRRLRRSLRYEAGLSYSVDLAYEPLTADTTHVSIAADALDENVMDVRDRLLSVLRELAADGPTDEELSREREEVAREFADPHAALARLYSAGTAELLSGPQLTPADLLDEFEQTTPASTAGALAAALDSALLVAQADDGVPDGFEPYSVKSPRPLGGRRHSLRGLRLRRSPDMPSLVAGSEGVALEARDYRAAVRFDECEVVLRDGPDRMLWSSDGFLVEVVVAAWRGGNDVVALIDKHVPDELHVALDREHGERVAAVGTAAAGFKRTWMTSDELDALPHVLRSGEEPRLIVRADKGWRTGVLAITDRRALFLNYANVLVDVPLSSIRTVRSGAGKKLTIETDTDSFTLTDIKGAELNEVAAVLERPDEPHVAHRGRVERVEAVAAAAVGLKRNWVTSDELDTLPDVLQLGEVPRLVVRATKGWWRTGVLAVTDRRALFLYVDKVLFDVALSSIRAVRSANPSAGSTLTIETDADLFTLTDIKGAALDEVAAALEHPLG